MAGSSRRPGLPSFAAASASLLCSSVISSSSSKAPPCFPMAAGIFLSSSSCSVSRAEYSSVGSLRKSKVLRHVANSSVLGKSPAERPYFCCTSSKIMSRLSMICSLRASEPQNHGILLRRWPRMQACTLTRRTRLTISSTLRLAASAGKPSISFMRDCASRSKMALWSECCSGLSQKDPMKTRTTSGVCRILPMLKSSAP
mmetsp:Transcript_26854/g.84163  ORF Transcript_26854/g.84163 Transcript_26854/m.84163 type:complete len:200 (+) Transcript_26854:210-809(+)